jgi:hypothetical protein
MNTSTSYPITPHAAANLVPRGGTILVETATGTADGFEAVRHAAAQIAAAAGARLVLYDTAAESYFSDPYPSGPWTAQVDGPDGRRPLTAAELPDLGRDALRRQVVDAGRTGMTAWAWLPRGVGAPAMADAARRTGAHLVVRAAGRGRPSLLTRLARRSDAAYRRAVPAPIVTVDVHGAVVIEQIACDLSAAVHYATGSSILAGATPR